MKTIIGIDPGKFGGIAILTGTLNQIYPMPLKDNQFDINTFLDILNPYYKDCGIVVEDVHAIFGASAKSTFNFGYICGQINASIITSLGEFIYIQPKVWQKEIWIEEDRIVIPKEQRYKNKIITVFKTDTKKTSFNACKRIFPLINVPTTPKSKVPHDGIVDALLLSEYGRRTYL